MNSPNVHQHFRRCDRHAPRRILITGANKGLGHEAARRLHRGRPRGLGRRPRRRAGAKRRRRSSARGSCGSTSPTTPRSPPPGRRRRRGRTRRPDQQRRDLGATGPIGETPSMTSADVYETNVFGTSASPRPSCRCSRGGRPVIVNVSSGMGASAHDDPDRIESKIVGLPYTSSKSAVNMLTSQYAKACRRCGSTRSTPATPAPTSTDGGPQTRRGRDRRDRRRGPARARRHDRRLHRPRGTVPW